MGYTGRLRGHTEFVFRQSVFGSLGHLAIFESAERVLCMILAGEKEGLRVETWCGKSYKYGANSNLTERDATVRNACEDCFIHYGTEDVTREIRDGRDFEDWAADERGPDKIHYGDLPF